MPRDPKPAKFKEAQPPAARKSRKNDDARVRDLERQLAEAQQREADALRREAEASKREAEAQEQQAATAEILRVISSSPTDVQPVFDAIVASAVRLCSALWGTLYRRYGDMVDSVASCNVPPEVRDLLRNGFPRPLRTGTSPHFHRALVEGTVATIPNVETDPDLSPRVLAFCRHYELRSVVMVPLRGQHEILGALVVGHRQVEAFSDSHMSLLQTFADQAVIAIENVRLFKELEARNRDLTTSLDKQTATSDILRVISRSPAAVQPVFEAIVTSAVRLLRAHVGTLTRVAGRQIALAALTSADAAGDAVLRASFPQPLQSEAPHARAIRDRVPVNIADAQADPVSEERRTIARARGYRSLATVPLLRHDEAVGTIGVARREPGGFTDDEIALLQTFADQAVIAIENVRLFTELQEKNRALTEAHAQVTETLDQQTATSEILRVIASSPTDVQPVFDAIVRSASRLLGGAGIALTHVREGLLHRVAEHYEDGRPAGAVNQYRQTYPRALDHPSPPAVAVRTGQMFSSPDTQNDPRVAPAIRENAAAVGDRKLVIMPMLRDGKGIGAIHASRGEAGSFSEAEIALLKTFADQAVIAIENDRLFKELEMANRELAAASQHKSEFLANMSHELRTPLNAIIGFSEVLSERMFGDLNEKQEEYLKDIYASGTHLLSLINDILDLSKIEAGRMELELSDFDLPTAIENALMLVRERAGRRSIALHTDIDTRLGQIQADERKVRQVVLNLLSNAIKFTPEGGRIDVAAVPKDGLVEVSVTDTGIGIAPEDQEKVFEEFRQVGTAAKKVEGTGLGLTLCRKFVELHGGRIWVKSEVGVGSTFTFTIPVRHGE